jgi:8-oxo-dGTP pyrophosphatase MutT (NUDIX family)
MNNIKFSPKQTTYQTQFFKIYHSQADFGAFIKDYFVVNFGPRGGIVAVRANSVLLVRQYRYLVDGLSWELPGGTIDDGESPELGAVRECREETGVMCLDLQPLVVYYPGLDNVDNRTTIWYSENIETKSQFVSNEEEVREIAWVPLQQCMDMIFRQEILDAMSVTGLLAYHHHRTR